MTTDFRRSFQSSFAIDFEKGIERLVESFSGFNSKLYTLTRHTVKDHISGLR